MAEPATPAESRRHGLRTARWIASGVAVGAAVVLTGTIATVNAATDGSSSGTSSGGTSSGGSSTASDVERYADDEFEDAQPFAPEPRSTVEATPQQPISPQSQTTSGGS